MGLLSLASWTSLTDRLLREPSEEGADLTEGRPGAREACGRCAGLEARNTLLFREGRR